jgi:protein-S-isoprenylcysteine O-methyltransferase Ste14
MNPDQKWNWGLHAVRAGLVVLMVADLVLAALWARALPFSWIQWALLPLAFIWFVLLAVLIKSERVFGPPQR